MARILGIDPGSRITGFGLIDSDGRRSRHVASGCLRLPEGKLPVRLRAIFDGLSALIEEHAPAVVAIESVFLHRNADSALKLGQARAAAICATFAAGAEIHEYAPRAIKQAVVGIGHADKSQVAHMVGILLNHRKTLQADAADALAVALCHAHSRPLQQTLAARLARAAEEGRA
jgi:crossover junction endodeoxyribonuclease RuvC